MESALHIKTSVLPGNRIEIISPDLKEGDTVDVFLLPENAKAPSLASSVKSTITEYLDSLPSGPRSFKTWEEMELQFRGERDSWDH